jgi:hypothetical protein
MPAMNESDDSTVHRLVVVTILLLAVFALSYRYLDSQTIEGLDSAHTIMDGFYFHDLIVDLPLNPVSYTLNYYRQYPALGFLFWPPFFPFLLGIGFLAGGLDIRIAHWCLFGFSFLMVWMAYLVARRILPRAVSVLAALLIITTPIVGRESIILMREIPALALALATFLVYLRFVESPGWKRGFLLAATGAAALYTKQTIVFIYPVLAFDLLVNHRGLLRDRRFWATAALLALLVAPLAVFTLGFSKVSVQQSLGSDRSYILGRVPTLDRWSMEAWTYYPGALPHILNPLILVLAIGASAYALRRNEFFRSNAMWFGWILAWLAVFSWMLAKEVRHAILWVPGWCMLAASLVAEAPRWNPRLKHVQWVLAIPVLIGASQTMQYRPPAYEGVQTLVNKLVDSSPGGNFMYFGRNRQVFIPYIRMRDTRRKIFTLQGDDVTAQVPIVPACHDYRVIYVIGEEEDADFRRALPQMEQSPEFSNMGAAQISPTWRAPISMRIFRYNGPMASRMRTVPLNSKLATDRLNEYVKP